MPVYSVSNNSISEEQDFQLSVPNSSNINFAKKIQRQAEEIKLLNKVLSTQQKDIQLMYQFIRSTFKSPELLAKQ